MPIYEFRCDDCSEEFEKLVRSADAIHEVKCPTCGSEKVNKRVSSFAAKVSGNSLTFAPSVSSCAPGGT